MIRRDLVVTCPLPVSPQRLRRFRSCHLWGASGLIPYVLLIEPIRALPGQVFAVSRVPLSSYGRLQAPMSCLVLQCWLRACSPDPALLDRKLS